MELVQQVQQAFAEHYQHQGEFAFRAPGRVNLIGAYRLQRWFCIAMRY